MSAEAGDGIRWSHEPGLKLPRLDGVVEVTMRRPDGREYLLRVPQEHLARVRELAQGEFGDKSIVMGKTK